MCRLRCGKRRPPGASVGVKDGQTYGDVNSIISLEVHSLLSSEVARRNEINVYG